MGVEIELSILVVIQTILISTFPKFEIETPRIIKPTKCLILI